MTGQASGRVLSVCTVAFGGEEPLHDAQWLAAVEGIRWTAISAIAWKGVGPDTNIVLAGGRGVVPTSVPANPRIPGLGPVLGVGLRLLATNRASRAAARAVRASPEAVAALQAADVIVCLDQVGERVGWVYSRRGGVLAFAGTSAAARAISSLRAQPPRP